MVRFVSLLQILMLTNSIHSLVSMFYFGGYLRILPIFWLQLNLLLLQKLVILIGAVSMKDISIV